MLAPVNNLPIKIQCQFYNIQLYSFSIDIFAMSIVKIILMTPHYARARACVKYGISYPRATDAYDRMDQNTRSLWGTGWMPLGCDR